MASHGNTKPPKPWPQCHPGQHLYRRSMTVPSRRSRAKSKLPRPRWLLTVSLVSMAFVLGRANFIVLLARLSAREQAATSTLGSASLLLDLVFARKPKTAHSLLWFAAIKRLECVKDPAGLAPKGSFIAAQTIKREIGQVGQTQKAASERDIGSVGVFPRVRHRFHLICSTVRNSMHASGISPPEGCVNNVARTQK